ncbi:MAG: TolC family protein [Lentisphaeraceae bacterium]|nr:TolC family protein [Lentisphaeraceae bacterium]
MNTVKCILVALASLCSFSCQTIIVPENTVSTTLNTNFAIEEFNSAGVLPKSLSIDKAKKLALKNNPTLEAAGQRILKAKAVIEQAKALYYPTVTAAAGAIHQHHSPQGLNNLSTESYENYSAQLNTQWLIFDGFARKYKLLSARYNELSTRESYKDTQRLLIDAVSQAFYETILAAKQMEINKEIQEINEDFLKDTTVKEEAGASTKTEVNNFIVNKNDSYIAYLQAKNSFQTSKLVLIELLGLPEADTESFTTIYKSSKINVPKYKTAMGIALNNRPDLRALQASILSSEAQVNEAEGEYYPRVFLEGSYGASSFNEANFEESDRNSYYGIAMNWDLFTGNSTAALIMQRTAEKEENLKLLKSQWFEVISQIRQQRNSLINAIERQEVQTQSADLNKSIYEDTKEIYENGATTITRVNEVLTNYSISRLSQVQFEIETLRRKDLLNALMGINNK